jgi:hypothetical protein
MRSSFLLHYYSHFFSELSTFAQYKNVSRGLHNPILHRKYACSQKADLFADFHKNSSKNLLTNPVFVDILGKPL